MSGTWTRRRLLLAGGTAATGMIGIAAFSDNASATVSGEFTIPNGETVLADQELTDVRLTADASYSYSANAKIHGVELELHVGASADTLDLIARYTNGDLGTDQLQSTETLAGSLMSANDFSISDFQPSNGQLSRTVIAELRFYALRNGEVVAEAIKQETFDVVVKNEALQVETALGGTGDVSFVSG